VQTPVATAAVKGTEFSLKIQKAPAPKIKNQKSKIKNPLMAILTVREGTVEFSNAFGKVDATALTESQATADTAPTEPQRVSALKTFRLNRTGLYVTNRKLYLHLEPDYLVYPAGWIGVTVVSNSPSAETAAQPPANSAPVFSISGVRPDSPAALAGLQAGDVISAVDRQLLTNVWQVRAASIFNLNRPVLFSVRRANQERTVTVVPSRSPDAPVLPAIPQQIQDTLFLAAAQLIEAGYERQIALGKVTPGEIVLEQLLRSYPDAAAVQHNLAALYEAKDELGEAIRHYQRAVELDPQVSLYRVHLGVALRSIGNLERSVNELEEGVRLAPAWASATYELSDVYSVLERHEDALNALDAALQLNPLNVNLWQQKAEVLFRARQAQAALPVALKAIELDPTLSGNHGLLGYIYDDLGRKDDAEAEQRKAVELGPRNDSPYVNLANLVRARGRLDEAEALYRKAIEMEPDDAGALHGLGGVFFDRRQAAEAEKWYRKAFELDPNDAGFCASLGNILRVLGRLDQGEQLLRKAIELEPDNAEAQVNLGILYWQRKQWTQAEQLLLKAGELDSSMPVERFLALVYRSQGKLDQEEQALRRSLARNTNDLEACNSLSPRVGSR